MEINNDIQWSDDVENFLKDVGERCSCMAYLHAQAEKVYSNKSMYIDLPVIVLSTISGSLSLSAERVFGKENEKTERQEAKTKAGVKEAKEETNSSSRTTL